MFNEVRETEFLSRKNSPIKHIGIYKLDWLLDDNQLDCEGIIVAFDDKKYLIKSNAKSEDDFDFVYYEFTQEYECRKIVATAEEPICFVGKEVEEDISRVLRFRIGNRPILATADRNLITIGISHWDINDKWLEFGNDNLLNDR